jgi:hypothetical protein
MNGIHQGVSDVRSRPQQGKVGDLVYANHHVKTRTLINKAPQAEQVGSIVIDTATNDFLYQVTINDVLVEYQADAGTSKIEIANGLADAINAEPLVRGQIEAESDGVDTITLTGLWPGVEFSAEETSAPTKMTVSEADTAADSADPVPFGRLVLSTGYDDEGTEQGRLAVAAALAAQVATLTVDYVATELYGVEVEIDGERYGVEVAADTDDATTSAAIMAALNLKLPANTVVATNPSATTVVLTAEVAGKAFKVSTWQKIGTAASLSVAHTTATKETDINRVAAGVSIYALDEEITTVGGTAVEYPANAGVRVLKNGVIWVACDEAVSPGDAVYVETAAGADAGKFFKASSATRIKVPWAVWERDEFSTSSDGIAALRIDL